MSHFRIETAADANSRLETKDEHWGTCKHCGCYSFRHKLKTQSLTGLAGDVRLKGHIECTACGKACQPIKQNIVGQADPVQDSSRVQRFKQQLRLP